ncbi:MAG TPA: hypothetical protein VIF44_01245, partial [Candidatus Limnocylindrales bacterium]
LIRHDQEMGDQESFGRGGEVVRVHRASLMTRLAAFGNRTSIDRGEPIARGQAKRVDAAS